MASIIIGSVPAHGHVTPLLAVAKGFVDRGDDVRFITGSRFADKVTATGATFECLPAEADYDELEFNRRPERAKLKGVKAVAHDIEHVFARPAKAQYETLMATLADQPGRRHTRRTCLPRRRIHARATSGRRGLPSSCAPSSLCPSRVSMPHRSGWD